jgi:hypothetical protein
MSVTSRARHGTWSDELVRRSDVAPNIGRRRALRLLTVFGLSIFGKPGPPRVDALAAKQFGLDRDDLVDVLPGGHQAALRRRQSFHVLSSSQAYCLPRMSEMGVGGALWSPETGVVLRELAAVVREAVDLPERAGPPTMQRLRRPGWAFALVRDVLAGASVPMTATEIAREIERQHGQSISHPTVFHLLTRSRAARNGAFERADPGRYRLRRRT